MGCLISRFFRLVNGTARDFIRPDLGTKAICKEWHKSEKDSVFKSNCQRLWKTERVFQMSLNFFSTFCSKMPFSYSFIVCNNFNPPFSVCMSSEMKHIKGPLLITWNHLWSQTTQWSLHILYHYPATITTSTAAFILGVITESYLKFWTSLNILDYLPQVTWDRLCPSWFL